MRIAGDAEGPTDRSGEFKRARIFQTVFDGAITTHRESGQGAAIVRVDGAESFVDVRNQLLQNVCLVLVSSDPAAIDIPTIVSFGHHHDQAILRGVIRDLRARDPVGVVPGPTMQKIKYRITRSAGGAITGRQNYFIRKCGRDEITSELDCFD